MQKIRFEDKVIVENPKFPGDVVEGVFGSFIHVELGDSQIVRVYLDDETWIETKLRNVRLIDKKDQ